MGDSQTVSPTSAEVAAHVHRVATRHVSLVRVSEVARTEEGRPIHAVTVTDPDAPAAEKQHVLITAGHHGNEESGRLVALRLLDWLVTRPAAETRRKQKIVIMPNMSPDMAERDAYVPSEGISPMRDHAPGGPVTPAGAAFERIAGQLQPELYVDMHARGFAGCSYDMVLWSEPATYTEDDHLLRQIAADMARAGERTGIPHVTHPLSWPGFMSESPDTTSANAFAYRNFKSLSLMTETCESNEHAYPAKARAQAGLARMKALLACGNQRHPKLHHPGYPSFLIGMFARGLTAIGKTAAERRKSRVEIWRNRDGFGSFEMAHPEELDEKRIKVEYEGPPLARGVGFQTAIAGARDVGTVTVNGRRARPSETNGYCAWRHGACTFVVVAVRPFRPGTYDITIRCRQPS
jgi:hypothetical protein